MLIRYIILPGCALIQIPDVILRLYGYLSGNSKTKGATTPSSKMAMKGNLKSLSLSSAQLDQPNDQKVHFGKDDVICEDQTNVSINHIISSDSSYAARFDRMETIIFDILEKIGTVDANTHSKYDKI